MSNSDQRAENINRNLLNPNSLNGNGNGGNKSQINKSIEMHQRGSEPTIQPLKGGDDEKTGSDNFDLPPKPTFSPLFMDKSYPLWDTAPPVPPKAKATPLSPQAASKKAPSILLSALNSDSGFAGDRRVSESAGSLTNPNSGGRRASESVTNPNFQPSEKIFQRRQSEKGLGLGRDEKKNSKTESKTNKKKKKKTQESDQIDSNDLPISPNQDVSMPSTLSSSSSTCTWKVQDINQDHQSSQPRKLSNANIDGKARPRKVSIVSIEEKPSSPKGSVMALNSKPSSKATPMSPPPPEPPKKDPSLMAPIYSGGAFLGYASPGNHPIPQSSPRPIPNPQMSHFYPVRPSNGRPPNGMPLRPNHGPHRPNIMHRPPRPRTPNPNNMINLQSAPNAFVSVQRTKSPESVPIQFSSSAPPSNAASLRLNNNSPHINNNNAIRMNSVPTASQYYVHPENNTPSSLPHMAGQGSGRPLPRPPMPMRPAYRHGFQPQPSQPFQNQQPLQHMQRPFSQMHQQYPANQQKQQLQPGMFQHDGYSNPTNSNSRPVPRPMRPPHPLRNISVRTSDMPQSPKRKSSDSATPRTATPQTGTLKTASPNSKNFFNSSSSPPNDASSPSKVLRMDQIQLQPVAVNMNGFSTFSNTTLNSLSGTTSVLPIPNAGGQYRTNSINFTPQTVSGTRRSFEKNERPSQVAADKVKRISMDDNSLSRPTKQIAASVDDASEYEGSDISSSIGSAMGTNYTQSLSDQRPTFATLARIRQEQMPPDTTAQYLAELLNRQREEARYNKDPKVQFEYAKSLLAAGEPHLEEGFALLRKVANNGHSDAHYFLGEAYADDDKYHLAYSQFICSAKRGHTEGCHAVAELAETGKGCKRNYRLALEMYTRAATTGSIPSMLRLGFAEMRGELRLKKDIVLATKWFKRAVTVPDRKYPQPFLELAKIYETGVPPFIIQDWAYARGVLQEAVDFGYPPALYKLGYSYEHGLMGFPVNPSESIRLYTMAIHGQFTEAYLGMAGWHMTGVEGILPQNQQVAFNLVKEAADRGLPRAQYTLGHFLEGGIGHDQDIQESFRYYTKAAEQGEERAIERIQKTNPNADFSRRNTEPTKKKKKKSIFRIFSN